MILLINLWNTQKRKKWTRVFVYCVQIHRIFKWQLLNSFIPFAHVMAIDSGSCFRNSKWIEMTLIILILNLFNYSSFLLVSFSLFALPLFQVRWSILQLGRQKSSQKRSLFKFRNVVKDGTQQTSGYRCGIVSLADARPFILFIYFFKFEHTWTSFAFCFSSYCFFSSFVCNDISVNKGYLIS